MVRALNPDLEPIGANSGEASNEDSAVETEPTTKKRGVEHWFFLAMAGCVVIAFVVLGVFISPDERGFGTHEKLGFPPCAVLEATGIPCPGCGVTTSVSLAANGRFVDSFVNQPFGLFFALASAAYALWAFWTHARGGDLHETVRKFRLGKWALRLGIAMGVAWVYKIVQLW